MANEISVAFKYLPHTACVTVPKIIICIEVEETGLTWYAQADANVSKNGVEFRFGNIIKRCNCVHSEHLRVEKLFHELEYSTTADFGFGRLLRDEIVKKYTREIDSRLADRNC